VLNHFFSVTLTSYKEKHISTLKNFFRRNRQANQTLNKIKMRSHLNANALFALIREDQQNVPDHRAAANASIPLDDALMSGFAMFSLKALRCCRLMNDGLSSLSASTVSMR